MRCAVLISLLAGCLLATVAPAHAVDRPVPQTEPALGTPTRIELWPAGKVPGEPRRPTLPNVIERSADAALPDRYIDNVSAPYLVAYPPAKPNGTALLVIPGGGYQRIVLDNEGTALVPAFVEQGGVTLFVLRYRLPAGRVDRQAALADAQRALRVIRAGAAKWQLDPARIGVMGFSAGGHVAARLSNGYATALPGTGDAIDTLSARPDFALLLYPVIDMGRHAHAGSRTRLLGEHPTPALEQQYSMQAQVSAQTPPTFLVHAQDDEVVPVQNSLQYYQALLAAGVPGEMHLFAHGGHGFGVRLPADALAAQWPTLALRWMRAQNTGSTP
ncbi:alpha/beta hydrolase [Stenotrophomonas sp. ISL-67]|uniref:alpha/beta hydrolase n=1 Tax=Stenotrophomonas sp. ISL-67 TaxID=2819171 RepID=UPI001BE91D87|nr:alpha/beta hydrolase [Stenotrophomonas sp. ISL-67]MBT2767269.1 alpha/beta hydrolase [Stenotrophomonas sp. ISL-67]